MTSPEQSARPIRTAEAQHNTHSHGSFEIAVYEVSGKEHLALVKGEVRGKEDVPVRIQSACIPGTALDSADCECREQVEGSFDILDQHPNGVMLYMDEEGRGLGLATKIRALSHKNKGLDTFAAVEALGLPSDMRDHQDAAHILHDLGMTSVQIITNNPAKIRGLLQAEVIVTGRIPIEIPATDRTRKHLQAKQKAGHLLTQRL